MTSRERFLTALNHGTPDRVPVYDFLFSQNLLKDTLGFNTRLYDGAAQVKLASRLGLDGMFLPINGYCGFEDEEHAAGESYVDEWGVTYINNGWPVMVQTEVALKSRGDWEKYKLPPVKTPGRLKIITDGIKANENNLALIGGFLGPFTMAYWYFFDLASLSLMIYDDPDLVHEINNAYVDWALKVAQAVYDLGKIDVFLIADDWGGTSSLLMSPAHLREFFIPPFRKMVQGMKALGLPVIMHNDGKLHDVIADLVATGIDGYHPVERGAGMVLADIKKQFGTGLCPVGNIDNKTTMVNGSVEDVEREAADCIRTAGPLGSYILATDHSLHDGIPVDNIKAYIACAEKYGRYPIIG